MTDIPTEWTFHEWLLVLYWSVAGNKSNPESDLGGSSVISSHPITLEVWSSKEFTTRDDPIIPLYVSIFWSRTKRFKIVFLTAYQNFSSINWKLNVMEIINRSGQWPFVSSGVYNYDFKSFCLPVTHGISENKNNFLGVHASECLHTKQTNFLSLGTHGSD